MVALKIFDNKLMNSFSNMTCYVSKRKRKLIVRCPIIFCLKAGSAKITAVKAA